MNPEEYLDRLIERRNQGLEPLPVLNDEIASSLAATQALTQLNEIDVPPAFAQKLEGAIRTRARDLAQQDGRLLPTTSQFRIPYNVLPSRPLQPQQPSQAPRSSRRKPLRARRTLIAALGLAAALLLSCVGILTVSASSLPGDALYGLKQAEEQFTANFASSPQDRISVQLNQLHSALADLNTVVNAKRDDDVIRLALTTVVNKTDNARGAVAALASGTERDTAQRNLDSVLSGEDQTLRGLLNQVDWPIRLAITRQLGTLGDGVPTLARVTVLVQPNGKLLMTLTGAYFASGVRLVIDGQSVGTTTTVTTITQQSSGKVVALMSNATLLRGEHEIGVLNPDGTAAQIAFGKDTDNDLQDDNRARYGTPEPTRSSGSNSSSYDD